MNQEIKLDLPNFISQERKELILNFIEYVESEALYPTEYLINLINLMSSYKDIIKFKSNSHRNYVQIGGSILALAIIRLVSYFKAVILIGALSEEDKITFSKLRAYCKKKGLMLAEFSIEMQEILSSGIVVSISNVEIIPDWFHAYFKDSEIYVKSDLLASFPGYCIYSKFVFMSFESEIYPMIIEQDLKESSGLVDLIELEDQVVLSKYRKVAFQTLVSKFPRILGRNPLILESGRNLINRISNYFIEPSKNKFYIINDFCKLLSELLIEFLHSPDRKMELCLIYILTEGLVSWIGYFSIHRTVLCSIFLTLFAEAIRSKSTQDLSIIEIIITEITAVELPLDHQNIILKSFKTLIKKKKDIVELLTKLDNPDLEFSEDDPNFYEKFRKEELKEIQKLIPKFVLVHPPEFCVMGKTLMGGIITLSRDIFPVKVTNPIKLASFLLVMRHELCHKKWYLKGSAKDFMKNTPPFKNFSFQEAGGYLDTIAFGGVTGEKSFSFGKMTQEIAEKILSNTELEPNELDAIYESEGNVHYMKSFGMMHHTGSRLLCGGRISRFN